MLQPTVMLITGLDGSVTDGHAIPAIKEDPS